MGIEKLDRRVLAKDDSLGRGPDGNAEQNANQEKLLTPEELAEQYETYRRAGGERIAAYLVEANNVLTIAGARPQTEFFIDNPTDVDYARLKAVATEAAKVGIEIKPSGEFDAPTGVRTLPVNVFNCKALERLSRNPPFPGLPRYDAKTGIDGAHEWLSHAYAVIEEMQRRGEVPQGADLDHVMSGLEKGYPWIAVLDIAKADAERIPIENFPSTHLPSADVYGGARPEFDYAVEHENEPTIRAIVQEWESVLQSFYATEWHKKIAADATFQSERLASLGLAHKQLQQQVRLPKDKWSPEFKAHVARLIRDEQWRQAHESSRSPEEDRGSTFRHYLRSLGLERDALHDKRVVDLGSGDGGFVIRCLERNVTQEAYGIDTEPEIKDAAEHEGHFFTSDFRNSLPIGDADYVVSVGAVSLGIDAENGLEDTKQILRNALAATKQGGEVRVFTVQEPAAANPYEHLQETRKRWEQIAKEFSSEGHGASIEPLDVFITGKDNDVILNSVLILKKK